LLLPPFVVVLVVMELFDVMRLFIDDLSTKEGKNGSDGRNGVVPLILAINDLVLLRGIFVLWFVAAVSFVSGFSLLVGYFFVWRITGTQEFA